MLLNVNSQSGPKTFRASCRLDSGNTMVAHIKIVVGVLQDCLLKSARNDHFHDLVFSNGRSTKETVILLYKVKTGY